jgi:hypothetical protein
MAEEKGKRFKRRHDMKKLFWSALAAVGLGLGFAPQQASAAWVVQTAYHWDPGCGHMVAYPKRCWVPECRPCAPVAAPCPAPVFHGERHHYGHHGFHDRH